MESFLIVFGPNPKCTEIIIFKNQRLNDYNIINEYINAL